MADVAATTLRDARRAAGLTQSELARRAGVQQSVVSVYESGRRQPSVPMLARLVEATGHELVVAVAPVQDRAALTGPLGHRVRRHRAALRAAAAHRGVQNLRVFGSVARGEEHDASDVDLIGDLPEEMGLVALSRLTRELSSILGAPVDLVPADGLKDELRSRVLDEAIAL